MAAKKIDRELVMFQIDQLRQDKIVYTLESSALSLLAFLFYITAPAILPNVFGPLGDPSVQKQVLSVIFGAPFLYWVFAILSNIVRVKRIKRLESEL